VIGRVQRNIILRNLLQLKVPAAATAEAKQILDSMPNIVRVASINEADGLFQLEPTEPPHGNSATAYQLNNKILSALIRAKIPILSFGIVGGRLQDVFLHLTEEAIE
jgi:hypothetical protein